MSHGPDHRILTIPLFVSGAIGLAVGLAGLLLKSFGVAGITNPGGLAGASLTMLVAALAVGLAARRTAPPAAEKPDIVPIPIAPRERRNRRVAGIVGAVALVLLAAGVYGAGLAGTVTGDADEGVDALSTGAIPDAATFLGGETFTGTLQGATLPGGTGVGGTGTAVAVHELDVLEGTDAFHHELTWDANTGGATRLYLALEALDGDAWEEIERVAGGSGLLLAIEELPADVEKFRLRVGIPDGAGSTPIDYEIAAHYYAGGIPG